MFILDVREQDEFEVEHVPGSILCPLSSLSVLAPGILKNIQADEITVMCRSGNRAKMAIEELKKIDKVNRHYICYQGGLLKWKSEGNETVGSKNSAIPIMRQVQIGASSLILLGFLGHWFIHPYFVYLALFAGLGLGLAGISGFCPMGILLQKMPWNQGQKANSQCSTTNNLEGLS